MMRSLLRYFQRSTWAIPLLLCFVSALLLSLPSCVDSLQPSSGSLTTARAAVRPISTSELLSQSWNAYRDRFIQGDGRVIDRESADRTTSEAQAYALLRSVLMDDASTFERVLNWGENNLQRRGLDGNRSDRLWAWQWGHNLEKNQWLPLDANFASDGDVDTITALIFAGRRWRRSDYLDLAKLKLKDLWSLAVLPIRHSNGDTSYFLPGPKAVFQPQPNQILLNPSYLAPYAFRLFAQIDPERDWLSLVSSSYDLLADSAQLSSLRLPSNWVLLETTTRKILPNDPSSPLHSRYGYDAYRVWWRLALDAIWFDEPRAKQYLQTHLEPLQALWRSQQQIPAEIDLQGQAIVPYESTAQYAMLYAAFALINPDLANQIRLQKLLPAFRDGFWENDSAYYIQNLGWLGLYPPDQVAANWLQP
ncbi:MAG: glycosyl hydrolase [Leptolyngbyaceae cyanobacterium CSU_1_4]|nr:glycosyl hydrolase [Leptolyngbyaceae cyanobacterium CSU_1_4]